MRHLKVLAMIALWIGLSTLASGCATSGIIGHGASGPEPERGVAGLTRAQERLLRRGLGRPTRAALDAMRPSDTTLHMQMLVGPLRNTGLLLALLNRLDSDKQATLSELESRTGIPLLTSWDTIAMWTTASSIEDSDGLMHISGISTTVPAEKLIAWLNVVSELSERDDTSDRVQGQAEVIIGAEVAPGHMDAVFKALESDDKPQQRLDFSDRTALACQVDDGRLNFTYIWPHGIAAGELPSFTGPPMEAAAAAAAALVARLDTVIAQNESLPASLPTVEIHGIFKERPHHITLEVSDSVSLTYESSLETFGDPEKISALVSQWELMRNVLKAGIEKSLANRPELRDLMLEALENASVNETGDGLRVETLVSMDRLVAAIEALPSP